MPIKVVLTSQYLLVKVEENGEAQGEGAEDSWVSLYRWYASILERTGHAMLMISPPSSPGRATALEKVDVNCRDYYCRTAVHYAAEQGHDDILISLLDAGKSSQLIAKIGITWFQV